MEKPQSMGSQRSDTTEWLNNNSEITNSNLTSSRLQKGLLFHIINNFYLFYFSKNVLWHTFICYFILILITIPLNRLHCSVFTDKKTKVIVKLKSLSLVLLFATPRSSIHGIFQARVLEWVAISFSRGSFQPRDQTRFSHIVGRCFTVWATREV